MKLDITTIKITDIKPAEYNPRLISPSDFTKLSNSISTYGLVDPIIINLKNNTIIGGHQRYKYLLQEYETHGLYESLTLLKRGDIGWCFLEEDLNIKNSTHEKGLNIALNKINGEWDYPLLNDLLVELDSLDFDLDLTGFDGLNIEELDFDLNDIKLNNGGQLYVQFNDKESQEELYDILTSEGYDCKIY